MRRVTIARNFVSQPYWKIAIGVPLIYLPLLTTIPFVIIAVFLVRTHLNYMGAVDVRSYWSFVPDWITHRYNHDDQITYKTGATWYNLRGSRIYWLFNCKLYCPLSVALFAYLTYLVKIVENWWCPFGHEKKPEYLDAAIDHSYWHIHDVERDALAPEDRDNPIWNVDTEERVKDR